MPIRIPTKADMDTVNAFNDVEKRLNELSDKLDAIAVLEQKVKILETPVDIPVPTFHTQGDTVIAGDLRVEGDTNIRGNVYAPQILDGVVVTTPAAITSSAQRVVEVHGSLAVLNGLSAENVRTNNLQVYGTASGAGISFAGVPRLLYQRTGDASSAGAGTETTVSTYTLDASTWMANDGDRIIVQSQIAIPAASTWTITIYYGSETVTWSDIGYGGLALIWTARATFIRTGAATQLKFLENAGYYTAGGSNYLPRVAPASGTQSNSGNVEVKVTLTDASVSTEKFSTIYAIKAP